MGPAGLRNGNRLVPRIDSLVVYTNFHLPFTNFEPSGFGLGFRFSSSPQSLSIFVRSGPLARSPLSSGDISVRSYPLTLSLYKGRQRGDYTCFFLLGRSNPSDARANMVRRHVLLGGSLTREMRSGMSCFGLRALASSPLRRGSKSRPLRRRTTSITFDRSSAPHGNFPSVTAPSKDVRSDRLEKYLVANANEKSSNGDAFAKEEFYEAVIERGQSTPERTNEHTPGVESSDAREEVWSDRLPLKRRKGIHLADFCGRIRIDCPKQSPVQTPHSHYPVNDAHSFNEGDDVTRVVP